MQTAVTMCAVQGDDDSLTDDDDNRSLASEVAKGRLSSSSLPIPDRDCVALLTILATS